MTRPKKPIIAVTRPSKGGAISWFFIRLAIWMVGGKAIKFTVHNDKAKDHDFDGLLISGGTDIEPHYYEGKEKPDYAYDGPRDQLEMALLKKAEAEDKPVLGICRGAQLINIFRGGNLHFDVSKAYEKANYPNSTLARIFFRKRMHIKDENALIYRLLGCNSCRVNSIHTQSINHLGANLTITSAEENGVVQVIEDTSRPYYLGVQFHPEYLIYDADYRNIFKALVTEARKGLSS